MDDQPRNRLEDFTTGTRAGLVAAIVSAVCFWNYVVCVLGTMDPRKTKEGPAAANVLAVLPTVLLVRLTGPFTDGGIEAAPSWEVVGSGRGARRPEGRRRTRRAVPSSRP